MYQALSETRGKKETSKMAALLTMLPPPAQNMTLLGEALAIGTGRSTVAPKQEHLTALIAHYRQLQRVRLVPPDEDDEFGNADWRRQQRERSQAWDEERRARREAM